jgi:preprotein translocase subunit SecF
MQIFVNPNFNFIKYRWHGVIASLLIVLAGLGFFMAKGVDMGIDFAGGANIVLKFTGDVPIDTLRQQLPDATIQQYGKTADHAVLIRLPQQGREGDYAGGVVTALHEKLNPESGTKHDLNYLGRDRLADLLRTSDPDVKGTNPAAQAYYTDIAQKVIDARSAAGIFTAMDQVSKVPGVTAGVMKVIGERAFLGKFNVLNQETVGPQVGSELQKKAILAIVLSSIAMGIYIGLRFDMIFGLSAVVCIVHDVAIALAFLVMMRLEFSLNVVAALLTIVGYSINDTVVMYDRVRENKKKMKTSMSLADHLNLAINQTLSRTILTSGTVFLVLLAMLAFGGDVIRGFSWILTIGVLSGTYSTLLVVPAFAIVFDRWMSGRRTTAPVTSRNDSEMGVTPRAKRKVS